MPFGGTKASRYGHFGGSADVSEFTDLQWIAATALAVCRRPSRRWRSLN